ncbi:Conserved_hypothetical protein [Hexamita inflata]|uniref:Uncharacterized protein n=1 Tax=Hexamita inflata TaxID=28002 RepID=A0AA86R2W9_9EUKA|nr:Conserved hypothetical protein [Hexamita inflata]
MEQDEWILDARIWNGANTRKLISKIAYDFSQSVSTFITADASVVNVKNLRLETQYRGMCTFSSIDMMTGTLIKNALFVVDVDLLIPKNCMDVEISFANSISGQLDNISLTGNIRITTEAGMKPTFKLSQLGGHIFNQDDQDFLLNSYFTNLTYFINGAVVNENSTNVFVYPNNFDNVQITTKNHNSIDSKIQQASINSCTGKQNISVTEAAALHPGLVQEWYEQRLDLLQWKETHSKYYHADFDMNGAIIIDSQKSEQRAYYGGNTPVAIFLKDGTTMECPKFYQPFDKTCQSSCDTKVFGPFCLKNCTGMYATDNDNNNCYKRCPADLGFVLINKVCSKCSILAVDQGQCTSTQSCPQGYIPVGMGCYAEQQHVQNYLIEQCSTVCEPGKVMNQAICDSSCNDGYIKQLSLRTCVQCTSDYNGGKFWNRQTQSCTNKCQYYNGTFCEELGGVYCPLFYVADGKNVCIAKCDATYKYLVESEKQCYQVCPSAFSMTDPIDMKCLVSCQNLFYNYENGVKTCLPSCDISNFKAIEADKSTTDYRCESSCAAFDDKPYSDNHICVPFCPNSKKFVHSDKITCVDTCLFYKVSGQNLLCQDSCAGQFNGVDTKYDNTQLRCEANCSLFSSVKFTQDEQCLDKCSGIKPYFITGNICVSQCYDQVSEKFLNEASNQCVSSCNSQTYYRNNANQFLFCSPSACAPTNFTGVELYHASYMRCESSCSAFSDLKYSDSQTCIKACSDTKKFSDSDLTCYSQCPFTLFTEGNSCVKQCATGNFSISDNTRTCENACQKYSYLDSDNMRVCVQTCPEAKPLINALTQECTATCDQPLYSILDNTVNCLTKCEFVHGIDVKFSETMERCEQSCLMFSSEKFTMNDLCVDKCTEAKPYSSTDNVCVENCYQQKSLRYVGDGNRCVSKCDFYKIIGKDIQCVKSCDQLEVRLVSQEQTFCYKDCGLQVYHPIKNECVDSCSGEYVSFSKVCMLSCPEGFQKNNNICTANKSGNKTIMLTAIGATVAILIIVVILAIIYKKRKANTKGTKKTSKVSKAGKDTMYYARRLNLDPNDKKVRNPNKVGQRVNILDEKPPKYVEMKNSVTQLKDSVSIRDSVNSRSRTASINQRRNSNSMDQFAHIQSNSSSENSQHKRKQVSSKLQTTLGEQPVW